MYIYTCIYINIYTYMCIHFYVNMYTYIYIYKFVYIYSCKLKCTKHSPLKSLGVGLVVLLGGY